MSSNEVSSYENENLNLLRRDISFLKTQLTNVQITLNTLVWAHKDNPQQRFYKKAIEESDEDFEGEDDAD